jgi:RimJ/RimL family protein N-acetyltransferase
MEPPSRLEPVEIAAGRFQLRPPALSDAGDLLALALDPDVRLWSPFRRVGTEDEAREWCRTWSDWDGGRAPKFVVCDAAEGKLLGLVSLNSVDFRDQSAELGYLTAPWARGQGVATAAVRSVAEWGFSTLGLVRIQLSHAVGNQGSCHVAERAGFLQEGLARSSHRYGDGELHDEHLHARLAGD